MQRKWLIAIPILVVLLLLCAAMTVAGVVTARRLASADGLFVYGLSTYDVSAERDDENSFEVSAPARLEVENVCGSVDVRAGSDGVIRYKAHITAWGKNEEDAARALETVQIDAVQDGDTVRLKLKNPDEVCNGRNRRPPSVDFSIEAPAQTVAQLTTTMGSVSLDGLEGDAELHSDFGSVTARNLAGALLAESDNGTITVSGVDAGEDAIQITSKFGRVEIEDIKAGSLTLSSVNGGAGLRRAAITGAAALGSDFGQVTWNGGRAGSLEITSKNGDLALRDLEIGGTVTLTNDFGGVDLTAVSAESYTITTKNGTIHVDGATGDVSAHSDFGNVSVRADNPVRIDLGSDNGTVTFEGSLAEGENTLRSRFGSIHLLLPQDTAFAFDLETGFGKISSDFPIRIEGTPDENHWRGTTGGSDAVQLLVSTNNGNITLEAVK